MTIYQYPNYMYHYGIKGMKWGVRKKYEKHPREFKYNKEYSEKNTIEKKKKELTPEEKRARNIKYAKRGALIVGGLVLAYGAYKLSTLPLNDNGASDSVTTKKTVDRLNEMKEAGSLGEAKIHTSAAKGHAYNKANLYDAKWYNGLSSSEKNAVTTYTGSGYTSMNLFLRDPKAYSKKYPKGFDVDTNKKVNDLTSALNKTSTKEDVVVHRGIGGALKSILGHDNVEDSVMKTREYRESLKGMRFTEKGFFSSGGSTADAWGGVKLHAYVPKGSKGAYVDPVSSYVGEHEFLLQRNSSFKINDVIAKDDGTITDIIVELIEQTI